MRQHETEVEAQERVVQAIQGTTGFLPVFAKRDVAAHVSEFAEL